MTNEYNINLNKKYLFEINWERCCIACLIKTRPIKKLFYKQFSGNT